MFVELHARSAFSFLEAAALPEALAERAAALGQPSVALLDADGVYGAPRLYRACTRLGLSARVGAEVTLADGSRLPLLAEDREGYQNLCRLLTRVKMRAAEGRGRGHPRRALRVRGRARLSHRRRPGAGGDRARARGRAGGPAPARAPRLDLRPLQRLRGAAAPPEPSGGSAQRVAARARPGACACGPLATNEPRLIARRDRPLLDALTCIREHVTLEAAGRRLARNSEHFMKSGATMERLFSDCPEAVANTGELAMRLGFTLKDLGYRFPDYPLPRGETADRLPARARPRGGAHPLRLGAARREGAAADRARAGPDRPARPRRLLPHRLGPGRSTAAPTTCWCRGAARRPTARCATPSASPRWIRWAWSCSSSASSPRSAGSGPTSTSTCRAGTAASR